MKIRAIVIAGLATLGFAAASEAQETWSISVNATQVTRATKAVTVNNGTTCRRFNLAVTCTQAQACTAAGAAGGASCTAAQARQANARIYPNTTAGREEFATFALIARDINDLITNAVVFDQQQWCASFRAASQANKDSACTVVGYTAGCDPCP